MEEVASKRQIWLMAIRPKTLPAALGPVLVGAGFGLQLGTFRPIPVIIAIIGALLLQILSNLGNDYFDYKSGHDTPDRVGPTRVMASGLLSVKEVKRGILINIVLAMLSGLYLVLIGGVPILVIGLVSILFALLYSGGPYPLSSHGLGDLFVFIFFGIVAVNGTYYVQALQWDAEVLVGSLAMGFLITAILVVNNYRDIETDEVTNKRTLAVRMGPHTTRTYYLVLLIFAYATPLAMVIIFGYSVFTLLPLLSLPLAVSLIRDLNTLLGPALNKVLGGTARLSLIYAVLFFVGLAL
ncbi:MAG: 1,4-dihydroxy-2-naphthoate polyprenyltransferase [Candidatus Kariarchaeaceae archaeon]|jgi:1,4-dihydroxy-2-naphthoate octaprenyltransferase